MLISNKLSKRGLTASQDSWIESCDPGYWKIERLSFFFLLTGQTPQLFWLTYIAREKFHCAHLFQTSVQ